MDNPIKMDDLGVPLFLETPIFPFPELGYVSSDLSACFSIRETEIIGENGEQHAVGKETSSLHHKDHVGKLLIVQVSGPESISFARGR